MKMINLSKAGELVEAYQVALQRLQMVQCDSRSVFPIEALVGAGDYGRGVRFAAGSIPREVVLKGAEDAFKAARVALLEIGVEPE